MTQQSRGSQQADRRVRSDRAEEHLARGEDLLPLSTLVRLLLTL